MGEPDSVQLSRLVDGASPVAVIAEARRIFRFWFDDAVWESVGKAASEIVELFSGKFPGYHACDTDYHDIRHTTDVLLATARVADGVFLERGPFAPELAQGLFIAAVCHDTGYIRKIEELGGTGARFTSVHVQRSADFIRVFGSRWGLDAASSGSAARMIFATGLKGEYSEQDWAAVREREAGAMLASADLVGQMADRAYLEKLLFLYYEFKEAGFPGYETEFDILRKTMGFYELTIKRLDESLGGIRSFARKHFAERWGVDRDLYAESMGRQMDYLQAILDDASTNFRKKLKRLDLELSQPKTA
jgi:hypothetical protein